MFGFIIALPSEYQVGSNGYEKKVINGFVTFSKETEVFIYSGVGKANAAAATMILINLFKVSKIINIGSAGSIDKSLNTFDIVVPNKISYFDVDLTHFGYKKNQMAKEQPFYTPTLNFEIPEAKITNLATGETFVTLDNYKSFDINGGIVDMEACSIALVCSKAVIPFFCVKVVSDSVFAEKMSDEQWSENIPKISAIISSLIKIIKK